MAANHVRSISLPCRSDAMSSSLEDKLNKLKISNTSSTSSKLDGLKDLYECVDSAMQLPHIQQSSSCVEEALDQSMRLLDACGTTRDVLSQMKEHTHSLQSSLRRRKTDESVFVKEVDAYLVSRKRLIKAINKNLNSLKTKGKNHTEKSIHTNSNLSSLMLQVEEVSVYVFESILSFISQSAVKQKLSGWSAVSKLLQSKRLLPEGRADAANEFKKVDVELIALKSSKEVKSVQAQNVLKALRALESSIQEMEEELECVFRRLVKIRVSLLNIFNH